VRGRLVHDVAMLKNPVFLLRLEGLALLAVSVLVYWHLGGGWWMFFGLLLAPDVMMLAYALNPRIGAAAYNSVHTWTLPLAVAVGAVATDYRIVLPYALIWLAHIGMDRVLGYGLKYPTHFQDTHLQRL
jgi:hypothetical protein